ncbi:hypothetical protein BKA56DRAFT_228273 [Ilyonectria sp. MPI-CAGE-AT-0026]|nr:hypothetical protein BKA56DRAFT_228273 [Ilyonectria sp. MPI-CAGE-AT-0026]
MVASLALLAHSAVRLSCHILQTVSSRIVVISSHRESRSKLAVSELVRVVFFFLVCSSPEYPCYRSDPTVKGAAMWVAIVNIMCVLFTPASPYQSARIPGMPGFRIGPSSALEVINRYLPGEDKVHVRR